MKTNLKLILNLLLSGILAIGLFACGGGGGDDGGSPVSVTYTVTYDSRGGSAVDPQTVNASEKATEPAEPARSGFVFIDWFKEADCVNQWDFKAETVNSNITLYAKWDWINYNLRDAGPAGGFIFYINPNYATDGWKYLEAAPTNQVYRAWGTFDFTVPGADGTAIGTGKQNTQDIINGDPASNKAADECANLSIEYNGITYNDWFLPSQGELNAIYTNLYLFGVGGLTGDGYSYWTSSELNAELAWAQIFRDGWQHYQYKNNNTGWYLIRACRQF